MTLRSALFLEFLQVTSRNGPHQPANPYLGIKKQQGLPFTYLIT